MADPQENGTVRYSVKELLGEINTKLDGLDTKLDKKVDVARVDALERRQDTIEHHGSRDAQEALLLSSELRGRVEGLQAWRARMVGAISVLSGSVALLAPIVIYNVFH